MTGSATPIKIAALRNSAPVFAALGDETRLRLVAALSDGKPRSIAQLAAGTPISRQAVTKHLEVLSKDLAVMDSTAIAMCRDNQLPVLVFNLNTTGNIMRMSMGENVGTLIN